MYHVPGVQHYMIYYQRFKMQKEYSLALHYKDGFFQFLFHQEKSKSGSTDLRKIITLYHQVSWHTAQPDHDQKCQANLSAYNGRDAH